MYENIVKEVEQNCKLVFFIWATWVICSKQFYIVKLKGYHNAPKHVWYNPNMKLNLALARWWWWQRWQRWQCSYIRCVADPEACYSPPPPPGDPALIIADCWLLLRHSRCWQIFLPKKLKPLYPHILTIYLCYTPPLPGGPALIIADWLVAGACYSPLPPYSGLLWLDGDDDKDDSAVISDEACYSPSPPGGVTCCWSSSY